MVTQVKALKVKIKSLAAESQIIRLEENKVLGRKKPDTLLYLSLREHRTADVRREQRAALLAYAFIRGKQYAACEKPATDNPPDLSRVRQLVEKFGGIPLRAKPCHLDTITQWANGTLAVHPFALPPKVRG